MTKFFTHVEQAWPLLEEERHEELKGDEEDQRRAPFGHLFKKLIGSD